VIRQGGGIVMTGRLSLERVQKCAVAGCGPLIAVFAPTAHALRLVEGAGITLAAFARGGGDYRGKPRARLTERGARALRGVPPRDVRRPSERRGPSCRYAPS
jgi:hypothetical protein